MRVITFMKLFGFGLSFCVSPSAMVSQAADAKPVQVMIVGTFHMANPGHDLHNVHVDDVLTAKRQQELNAVANGLSRLHPTKVAVEWPRELVDQRYPQYLVGTLPPSHNEVVQLGFRVARNASVQGVYGIDADGDFPYEQLSKYAEAHGQMALLDDLSKKGDKFTAELQNTLDHQSISHTLRFINNPERVRNDNAFYRTVLRIGAGADQPGAELVSDWYHRNFLICANLLQLAVPGDRIIVFYGYGHEFLLRQCVAETPGFRLIEPNEYLPR